MDLERITHPLRAHRLANLEDGAARMVEVTRHAIGLWRQLAGLSVVAQKGFRATV